MLTLQGERLIRALAHTARTRYGLTVAEWLGHDHVDPVHAPNSLHYQTFPNSKCGRAFDAQGSWLRRLRFARYVAHNAPQVTEGIFNSGIPGHNLSIKNGSRVPASFWGAETWANHTSHVHIGV